MAGICSRRICVKLSGSLEGTKMHSKTPRAPCHAAASPGRRCPTNSDSHLAAAPWRRPQRAT
eukprot:2342708-Pyramimonas_sp.AAC.1